MHEPRAAARGSRARRLVGGLVAATALLGSPHEDALLARARAEGHPDNVAAALSEADRLLRERPTVTAISSRYPGPPLVALILRSRAPRQARPSFRRPCRPRRVFNVQRVALLLASLWAAARRARGGSRGPLHEPYRLRLFRGCLKSSSGARRGRARCVLSGAGPSLLAVAR